MHDPDRALLRARNVIVFGESGVGKSSVINTIAGKHITQTSNDAVGCTFRYQCYQVLLDGFTVNLWDTVGLDEGSEGTVPARQAESNLKAFLRQITRWNGIDLLLYCVRGTRVRQALLRNYNIFYAAICRKKVPVALVVTGLENYEGNMEAWWTKHEKDLVKHGMRFDAHACVTTMRSDHPAIQNRLKQSRDALRNLVQPNFETATWRADEEALISASLPDARALLQTAEKRVAPLIMICDATEQANRVQLFPSVAGSRATCISDRKYKCRYFDAQQVLLGDSKLCTETVQRPDLLIFRADADSEADRTWTIFERFHASFGGETCPIIIVLGDSIAMRLRLRCGDFCRPRTVEK
ncbi:P-loop containing nucleoside triphosphate hydrolase protein [Boletus coccyginus]|nr:P-loop containing nucleoside triphosphate hydrolase protein [Boletus coccyginus]